MESLASPPLAEPDFPLRAELLGPEQLADRAKSLAQGHRVARRRGSNRLLARLDENERILRAYNRATYAADQIRRVTHAAEWLLDNFYLIEDQIQMARRHLPRRYSDELPCLEAGRSAGLPRVYDLVSELISDVDAQIDAASLQAFVGAYQDAAFLTLGELWAVPIMLRLALIENLRAITDRLVLARHDRDLADHWADRLEKAAEHNPAKIILVAAEMEKTGLPVSSSFVAEFNKRLSRLGAVVQLARNWLDHRLAEQGLSVEGLVLLESHGQAADQVSVSHSIASLRFLGATDWRDFVEKVSRVEEALRSDPGDVYRRMDFATRDRYRHAVEALAKNGRLSEIEVARAALRLAQDGAAEKGVRSRAAHVGYYLIDKGLPALEAIAQARWSGKKAVERAIRRFPVAYYAGGIALLSCLGTWAVLARAAQAGAPRWVLWSLAPIVLLACSQLAVAALNWLSMLLVTPRLLPRLDYSSGITPDCRTMVVVPTMLSDAESIDYLIEALELHYLAGRDRNLHFALLTDLVDAPRELMPNDDALLRQMKAGVEALAKKYQDDRPDIFFLFHRPRKWNEREGQWMGHERKRGKLAEFNALLRGRGGVSFSEMVGDLSVLRSIKYVITLDTDTQLPREAASQLVGTIAHPLNQPQFDPATGVVTEGYSILQPRVGVRLPSARRSWFVRLFAGDVGIDPYTRAVSDVYQDVFAEGSFIGKGIYDVDAFERAVAGRFPENTILSHDLIESCHARSALVSDVVLYEEYPYRYNADTKRRHRWIRGDWQIAQWTLPRVPGPQDRSVANPLSGLSRWKIFDNLRRSLVPAALLALLLANWLAAPELGVLGPLLVLAIVLLPSVLALSGDLFRKPEDLPVSLYATELARSFGRELGHGLLTIAFLPYDAGVSLDAIGRSLLRVLFTQRRLLQWQTARDAEHSGGAQLAAFCATMWIAPAIALGTAVFLYLRQPHPFAVAAPILAFWFLAPLIAWRISQPIASPKPEFRPEQLAFLRRTARLTWSFFESFVTAEENWLPPDNFQERPGPHVASRTSPTNLGLALLANLAAWDFGYLPTAGLLQRTRDALATMRRLERYRGHFYNWYDTRTLQPLPPLYVSGVDSGNLAGHLLTLGAGLADLAESGIYRPRIFSGLHDTAEILRKLLGKNPEVAELSRRLAAAPDGLRRGVALLQESAAAAARMSAHLERDAGEEVKRWSAALERGCREQLAELLFLAPWIDQPRPPADSALPGLAEKLDRLERAPTLRETADLAGALCPEIETFLKGPEAARNGAGPGLAELLPRLRETANRAGERLLALEALARQSVELAEMDFTFLFDPSRELLTVGFNVAERRCDNSFYDLLASEARLGVYVAIAQGQVSQKHWFALGRLLVAAGGKPVLASWSGSMFEYLMPLLVMPSYEKTLLDETYQGVVERQIEYGRQCRLPWGVSESGYNLTDSRLDYQYRAFGVPGLGLKRGLADDLVIAPYASLLALMVAPRRACENLERLAAEGRQGPYGFYEAVDYTPSRLPPGQTSVTVRSYMAHHQGMGLLALDYLLLDRPMQRRFLLCPKFKAADLLLQERTLKIAAKELAKEETWKLAGQREDENTLRVLANPSLPTPEVHLLSNGRYHVALSSAGGGYSRWRDLAVTRWREDATRDCWGTFLYLREFATGDFWSAAFQPTLRETKRAEAIFTQGRAEFRQTFAHFDVHTEVCVSPEDDVELRRVQITNHASAPRRIELTSYAEVVLAPGAADAAHPAFSNLFVQTEFLPESSALLCTRRPRAEGERPPWLLNVLIAAEGATDQLTCETNRANFVGRGRSLADPAALHGLSPLANTVGSVLDPVVALRRTVTVPPNGTARLDFILGAAESREAALGLVEKYQNPRMTDRAFDLAWTHSQVILRNLNASEAQAQRYARMANALIYANPSRRGAPAELLKNRRGQNALWSQGISGDTPIVLLHLADAANIEIVRELIQAHAYWRVKGLAVELVILHEETAVYRQPLHDQIVGLIASGMEPPPLDRPGGIFVRRMDQIVPDDRTLLEAAARIVLVAENGPLSEQLERPDGSEPVPAALAPARTWWRDPLPALAARELIFHNGLGGFTPDGREYVITLQPGQATPAPWVNVLANPTFGTVVSESGGAYSWAENCHEFRLTPWSNDPVTDTSGEAFFLRDEHTGQFWCPTPAPVRSAAPTVIRHGFGYTVFEHQENGIASELWIYVAMDAPVKFAVLKTRNLSSRHRRLSATGYWEWVLGELRAKTLLHVQTEIDAKSGALLARNRYGADFAGAVAYVDVNEPTRTFTGDRREFIGRNGSLAQPAALKRVRLSGRSGAGLDPCAALQVTFELAAGQERETVFRLGCASSLAEAQAALQRFRRPDAARRALEGVWEYWKRTLGAVRVETPDPAVNVMANGWLLYQTLGCRLWARTGFYQSGGAFGFRDQLQDTMALVHAEPALAREHLLRAAARQFREGDVQHWWHPPSGRGVRTHFSDDFLWLPYAACRYVACVGDPGVLDEDVPFLEGRALMPEEESYYDLPGRADQSGTLYVHCVRAIEHGLAFGAHGLPLMGCGDWNDGMNLVGRAGHGESVWLAFFLCDVLTQFVPLARARGDGALAERCLTQARQLRQNLERHAWDGGWYRRAFFDDGEPLGSQVNPECQIDSLPQSWSVLSGAAEAPRARLAMAAVRQRLIHPDEGLIQLFTPPFDRSPLNPGYIKGYIPGVRENGGQYTHAAVWTAMAFALMGDHAYAWKLFSLLNPIKHADDPAKIHTYKAEPYVVAADVYAVAPHVGRGGWTWYTGSAGWMYRLVIETLCGLNLAGDRLVLTPRFPAHWPAVTIHYRHRRTRYRLLFTRLAPESSQLRQLFLDGAALPGEAVPLVDDGRDHAVELKFR